MKCKHDRIVWYGTIYTIKGMVRGMECEDCLLVKSFPETWFFPKAREYHHTLYAKKSEYGHS